MVGYRLHDNVFEAGFGGIGGNAGASLPNPLAHTTVSIVVKAVHAFRSHSTLLRIAVPTLPNSSGTVVYRIKPTGILALVEKFVGDVAHTVLCQRRHIAGGQRLVAQLGSRVVWLRAFVQIIREYA